MRFIFITLSILITTAAYSQRPRKIDAILVKKETKDTLNVKIKVSPLPFDKKNFDEGSIYKHIIVIDTNDKTWPEEKWLKPKEIDYLEFNDFKGNRRIFVSRQDSGNLSIMDPLIKKLYEVIYEGEISWYRRYYRNGFDGSVDYSYFLIKKGYDEPVFFGSFNRIRKQLKKLTTDMPELESHINNIMKEDDIMKVLQKYNEFKLSNQQIEN